MVVRRSFLILILKQALSVLMFEPMAGWSGRRATNRTNTPLTTLDTPTKWKRPAGVRRAVVTILLIAAPFGSFLGGLIGGAAASIGCGACADPYPAGAGKLTSGEVKLLWISCFIRADAARGGRNGRHDRSPRRKVA